MKTIKEIEKLAKNNESYLAYNYVDGFIDGYTQCQEDKKDNKYTEEDMQEYAEFCIRCYEKRLPCIIAKDWFEQFKNKQYNE